MKEVEKSQQHEGAGIASAVCHFMINLKSELFGVAGKNNIKVQPS